MTVTLHRGNRLEALADALADVARLPLGSPFAKERVVIPSRGMETWLAKRLASRLGVWANPAFPFPRAFVEELLLALSAGTPLPADRERLALAVAASLPDRVAEPAFADVRRYLDDDPGRDKLLALAARLGDLFDQYAVYRPELVTRWTRGGGDDDFQAVLFRDALARTATPHAAERVQAALDVLRRPALAPALLRALPERVSVFAVTSLPPLYLELLVALGRHADVHLFALSPTPLRFTDVAVRGVTFSEAEGPGVAGPPLLEALGKVGRDAHVLYERTLDDPEGRDHFERPEGRSVLATLQRDLHDLEARTTKLPFPAGDRSLAVHVCHGPMREVEVLRDDLFAAFVRDPSLDPADVVVMCPDIDRYAPYVDAVFGGATGREVPFRIADRREGQTREVFVAFRALLDAVAGRLGVTTLLDLLGQGPVRDAFGIEEGELGDVRDLLVEAEVRWGADGAHKAEWGQPPIEEHSIRFGLDRLLVGWAAGTVTDDLVLGVAAAEDVEGGRAGLVGRLAAFVGSLTEVRRDLVRPKSLPAHAAVLAPRLASWLDAREERAWQVDRLREVLGEIARDATDVGLGLEVSLAAFVARVEARLETRGGGAFLTGGVTFCELLPMRSIPFRVVALLGMNDGAFPRGGRTVAFDKLAEAPRLGDRNAREEDRMLFLECLLAARERLVVTYTGRSPKDGKELSPSVVVGELLDVIDRTFELPPAREGEAPPAARTQVATVHRLQAFAPEAFAAGAALPSFDETHAAAARALARGLTLVPPFVASDLGDPDALAAPRVVTLDALATFFKDPLRDLVLRRLGVRLGDDYAALTDDDRTDLDALAQFVFGGTLLGALAAGRSAGDAVARALAAGTVPSGPWGTLVAGEIAQDAERLAALAAASPLGAPLPPHAVDLTLGRFRVLGVVRNRRAGGVQSLRPGNLKAHVRLRAWIELLALAADTGASGLGAELLARRGDVERYAAPPDARAQLEALLELWALGRTRPLPLFTESGWAYLGAREKGPRRAKTAPPASAAERERHARSAARSNHDGDVPWAEAKQPHVRLLLGGADPWRDDDDDPLGAPALAHRVLGPLRAARLGSDDDDDDGADEGDDA